MSSVDHGMVIIPDEELELVPEQEMLFAPSLLNSLVWPSALRECTHGAGIGNIESFSCYVNSISQCLAHLSPLHAAFELDNHDAECPVAVALAVRGEPRSEDLDTTRTRLCPMCELRAFLPRILQQRSLRVEYPVMVIHDTLRELVSGKLSHRKFCVGVLQDAHEWFLELLHVLVVQGTLPTYSQERPEFSSKLD
jgi:hypothetical protein